MVVWRPMIPGREMFVVGMLLLLAMIAVLLSVGVDFPALHSILDTAVFIVSAVLAFLLWDIGWRTAAALPRHEAACFAVVAVLELLHVITALDFEYSPGAAVLLRLGTWSPAAYLLPLGLLAALRLSRRDSSPMVLASALVILAIGLMLLFAVVPRYTAPGFLGITRPTLVLAVLLWVPVIIAFWRRRHEDRLASAFAIFAAITLLV